MRKTKHDRSVILILLISLTLRGLLIVQGGQYFFSDEGRYESSRAFAKLALGGNLREAFQQFFIEPEHLGFKILGTLPALLEQFTRESLALPTVFFSLFSTLNLYVLYRIVRRTGYTEYASLLVLILAAATMSLLYFSRHLLPYDTAMTFGLLAVYVALGEQPNFKTSLACGALSFACFITYNGYWSLAGLAMLISSLRAKRSLPHSGGGDSFIALRAPRHDGFWMTFQQGFITAIGFALPALFLVGLAAWVGTDLLTEYRSFSNTVTQGQFSEGWSLPFEYFWHAEHLNFVLPSLLAGYAVWVGLGDKNKTTVFWAGCLILLYLCLVIPSVALNAFVVYGRLARQMTPFILLLAASGLSHLHAIHPWGNRLTAGILVVMAVQAVWNFQASYTLTYPREFAQQMQAGYPDFQFSEKRLTFGAPTLCQNNGYIAEFVKHFEAPPEPNPPIVSQVILSAPHPDNFLPYQYEGYTPAQRQAMRDMRIEMRLYRVDESFMNNANPLWQSVKSCVVKDE
jgi:hypothetical protein